MTIAAMALATMAGAAEPGKPTWVIAIHGGAGVKGTLKRDAPAGEREAYEAALQQALKIGEEKLAAGGSALDTCEAVCRFLEDNPLFNAGKGAVYTENGKHELDASIMDGKSLACGAVAGLRTVKNPISLARLVMEKTRHVLLAGEGAEQFATVQKVDRVENSYFDTPKQAAAYQQWLKKQEKAAGGGTIGCVCRDMQGNLAASTSTGGTMGKRFGRVGDSPIIGAGTYADNRSCAVSCTGTGEEFIRHGVAKTIANLMEWKGMSAKDAGNELIGRTLKPNVGGCIIVSRDGEVAMPFNTDGMFRGMADSTGRKRVAIWPESGEEGRR